MIPCIKLFTGNEFKLVKLLIKNVFLTISKLNLSACY